MNVPYYLSAILFLLPLTSSASNEDCIETLEILQMRWTIENFNQSDQYKSQNFPETNTTETTWRFETNGKKANRANYIGFSICLVDHLRSREFVRYSLGVLGKDFNSNGVYNLRVVDREIIFPRDDKHDCLMYLAFLHVNQSAEYVTNTGSIDFFAQVKRLRKLPACLLKNETDLGRGNIPLKPSPDLTASHCTGKERDIWKCHAICPMFGLQQTLQDKKRIQELENVVKTMTEVVKELKGVVRKMENINGYVH